MAKNNVVAINRAKSKTPPVDITLAMRADIEKRDWSRCHIEGDRGSAIRLPTNWMAPR